MLFYSTLQCVGLVRCSRRVVQLVSTVRQRGPLLVEMTEGLIHVLLQKERPRPVSIEMATLVQFEDGLPVQMERFGAQEVNDVERVWLAQKGSECSVHFAQHFDSLQQVLRCVLGTNLVQKDVQTKLGMDE